jgi:hypothetical protein
MKPEDWFGLGIRFTGVWCLLQSATYLMAFLDLCLGFSSIRDTPLYPSQLNSSSSYMIYMLGYAALALLFQFGASHFTKWTFRSPQGLPHAESRSEISRGDE